MLSNFSKSAFGTYGFRFKAEHLSRTIGLFSLGWEKQTSTSYYWNGLKRSEKNIIVFQYTLKGKGEIQIEGQTHMLNKGDAFFIKVPSDHCYYLPHHSGEWEFIHLTLHGKEALHSHQSITKDLGQVFKLDFHSTPVSMIFDLINDVANNQINDAFESSARAFNFLMELHRFALNLQTKNEWPESINKATTYIDNHYTSPITLDDIVEASGLSKYYFTRLFHQTIQLTPIQYLKKVRINKSIELLKNKSLTIEDIALKVGFSNGNYFTKVFRSSLGVPPGEFRNSKKFSPFDHLVSD